MGRIETIQRIGPADYAVDESLDELQLVHGHPAERPGILPLDLLHAPVHSRSCTSMLIDAVDYVGAVHTLAHVAATWRALAPRGRTADVTPLFMFGLALAIRNLEKE